MSVRDRVVQSQGFAGLTAEAFVTVIVAGDQLSQVGETVCARYGITSGQYNVLRILRGVYPGGHPRCEVARRLMRVAPDVTRLLDRLARRGLIKRERSPEDHRLSVARITDRGLDLLQRMQPEMETAMTDALSPLNASQLRQLVRLCDPLVP